MMLQRQNDVKGNNPSEYASDVRNQGTKSQLALILGQAPSGSRKGSAIQGMLAGERLPRNTLNINVVYTRTLGQSITCLSLPRSCP